MCTHEYADTTKTGEHHQVGTCRNCGEPVSRKNPNYDWSRRA